MEDQLTLLYQTNVVIYYPPIDLAIASLLMALKNEEIPL